MTLRKYTFVVLMLLMPAGLVNAHPHSWVDLSVRVVADDGGRLVALEEAWRLDPFYSAILLEELQADKDGMEAALDKLGGDMLQNLAPQGFFTEADIDGQALEFAPVTEATVMNNDGRVVLHFRLPLAEPTALDGHLLTYRVYDPSYYVEVVHESEDGRHPMPSALVPPTSLTCHHEIQLAEPDPEKVMEASALDRTDTASPGLGRFFAETGKVDCR